MNTTNTLMGEHRVIEQVLAVLEEIAACGERDGVIDTAAARDALDFFRTFADGCHHAKEERHLFPLLEARGLPREGGPTGVMLREHDLGRELLARMAAALDGKSDANFAVGWQLGGPPVSKPWVAGYVIAAREYVTLMRDHIRKEDERLFRLADRLLGPADDDNLVRAFDAAEHADMGAGTHEHYLELAGRLSDQFGIPRSSTVGTCGCSRQGAAIGTSGAT
jgi:hemerythrin-like domain-containing protein